MSTSGVIDVTDETFERDVIEASSTGFVVVDFWAPSCAPCLALGPVLERAVNEHDHLTLVKVNVEDNPQTAMALGIRGIPAVKAFRGGKVVAEFVGGYPAPLVERFLASLTGDGHELATDPVLVEAERAIQQAFGARDANSGDVTAQS
jgi:putative thioredoxin